MIFISYSLKDEAAFTSLCLALEAAGLSYWPGQLKAGESLKGQLRDAISKCDVCIFVATKNSVTSPWCLNEIGAFWGAGKRIILYAANHDIKNDLPPLFKGDHWTSNAREVIKQVADELEEVKKLQNQNNEVVIENVASAKAETNIVCTGAKTIVVVTSGGTFYDLKDHKQLEEYAYEAAIVEFENKPVSGRRVGPLFDVEAQVSFYDSNREERERVEGGMWVGERGKHTAFKVGRRKRLVVAFRKHHGQELVLSTAHNNREVPDSNVNPTFTELDLKPTILDPKGKWLRVNVRLIAHGEIINEEYFELEIVALGQLPNYLSIKKLSRR